jgi:uncharacterized small protein (DUF1192 family)
LTRDEVSILTAGDLEAAAAALNEEPERTKRRRWLGG